MVFLSFFQDFALCSATFTSHKRQIKNDFIGQKMKTITAAYIYTHAHKCV